MARVFVAEDEPLVSMMLEEFLTDLSHVTVGPAATVEAGLQLLANETDLDLAVLDLLLHKQSSWPLAEELSSRGVPFVLATGWRLA